MGIPTSVLVMLFALLFIGGLEFGFTRSIDSNVSCIESEREALVKFKQSLIDELNRLSSWVGEDCCTWRGVSCSEKAGHVVKLDLHNSNDFDYRRSSLGVLFKSVLSISLGTMG
uniref:Leucine-rich repeat-containing N-terminal plant-type domain-containing protein n=1 Tax=Davidia involucrata TaxID=16924 RepID=A0A5B7BYH3_DAVIN